MFEQDYIMRLIREMLRTLLLLLSKVHKVLTGQCSYDRMCLCRCRENTYA